MPGLLLQSIRPHPGVEFEQLFEPLGVVPEPAADIDAFERLVVSLMGMAQIIGYLFRGVEIGDGCGEMRLARQQYVFGASRQIGFVLFGEPGDGESVPAERVGLAEVGSHAHANRPDPDPMQARGNQRHVPQGGVVKGERLFLNDTVRRKDANW